MKRFLFLITTVALVLGAVGWATAETTVPFRVKEGNAFIGSLTWAPVSNATARQLTDTLLTTLSDTSSQVLIAGAKTVDFYHLIDPKGAKGNNYNVIPQVSVDGTYWQNVAPTWSLGASTTQAVYHSALLRPSTADSTVGSAPLGSGNWWNSIAGAKYLRVIVDDIGNTTTKDTTFHSLKYNVVY